jgi:hypothetical protein
MFALPRPRVRRGIFRLAIAFLSASAALLAQTSLGSISGLITDETGAAVPMAKISVINLETNVRTQAGSDVDGVYNLTSLNPGRYRIEIEKSGFDKEVVSEVIVSASQAVTADAKLKIGNASTVVTVGAHSDLLQKSSSDVATTIDHDLVENLAYAVRCSLGAVLLVPGVSGDATMPGGILSENPGIYQSTVVPGASIRVGGGWPGQTSILMDGSDVTQASYPRVGISLSGSMVQETTVVTNGLSAKYGRTGGGVIVQASRGGVNALHAEASWRHSDPGIDAFPYGSTARSGTHQQFFGGYLGGPVYVPKVYNGRNKTFFYVGVEPARLMGTSGSTVLLPTPAELAGDFSNSYALINTTILKNQGVDAALAAPRTGALYYQTPVNAAGFPVGAKYSSVSQYVPIPNDNVSAQLAAKRHQCELDSRRAERGQPLLLPHRSRPQSAGPRLRALHRGSALLRALLWIAAEFARAAGSGQFGSIERRRLRRNPRLHLYPGQRIPRHLHARASARSASPSRPAPTVGVRRSTKTIR